MHGRQVMTNIYHIVHFTHDDSIYVNFEGCNFHCKGCLLKRTMWDCHLADYFQRRLQAIKDFRRLSVSEFESIIKKLDARRAVLGGGEPTLDEELPEVIELLSGRNIETHLLTNGQNLNESARGYNEGQLQGQRMHLSDHLAGSIPLTLSGVPLCFLICHDDEGSLSIGLVPGFHS